MNTDLSCAKDDIQDYMFKKQVESCKVLEQPKLVRITEKTIIDNVLSDGYVDSTELAEKHQPDPILVQDAVHHTEERQTSW